MSKISAAAILAGAIALAGCQTTAGGGARIDGRWDASDGASYSELSNGRVISRATANNAVLATGSYICVEKDLVKIDLIASQSGQNRSTVCVLKGRNTLECELDQDRFVLNRVA